MVSTHTIFSVACQRHVDVLGGKITKNFGVAPNNSEVFPTNYYFLTIGALPLGHQIPCAAVGVAALETELAAA